jgi:seryl-tRNA synthetase
MNTHHIFGALFADQLRRSYGYKPSDYYFKYNKKGNKMYYSKIANKVIAKNDVPKEFITLITENRTISNESLLELEEQKQKYTVQLNEMKDKIEQIDAKIKLMRDTGKWKSESPIKLKEQWKQDDIKKKVDHEKERDEKFAEFMNRFKSYENKQQQSQPNPPKPPSKDNIKDADDLLSKHSISDKKALKMWLLKNHPDKGGDEQLCMEIMGAAKIKGWLK